MNISDLVGDCLKEISERLLPVDWLAFSWATWHFYEPTEDERTLRKEAQHGLPWCTINRRSSAALHLLQFQTDARSSTNTMLLAAAHDNVDVIEWLSSNRPEVKVSLAYAALIAVEHNSDGCSTYLIPLLDVQRRYHCSSMINYGKLKFGPSGAVTLSQYATYKSYSGVRRFSKRLYDMILRAKHQTSE